MPKLPIDFEQKVKQAPAAGGTGYPYRISAADLMRNFDHCNIEVGGLPINGLYLTEESDAFGRTIMLAGDPDNDLEARVAQLEYRLNDASITAECLGGEVIVTLMI